MTEYLKLWEIIGADTTLYLPAVLFFGQSGVSLGFMAQILQGDTILPKTSTMGIR